MKNVPGGMTTIQHDYTHIPLRPLRVNSVEPRVPRTVAELRKYDGQDTKSPRIATALLSDVGMLHEYAFAILSHPKSNHNADPMSAQTIPPSEPRQLGALDFACGLRWLPEPLVGIRTEEGSQNNINRERKTDLGGGGGSGVTTCEGGVGVAVVPLVLDMHTGWRGEGGCEWSVRCAVASSKPPAHKVSLAVLVSVRRCKRVRWKGSRSIEIVERTIW